ncbi:MAG: glycosyltransferase family 2 protein [Deltaproteobacteria bacterium]|nr:glycosyltransferase family 2 protein [Deltaproteobacteria bacterium]
MIDLSILIVSYNTRELLLHCLEGIFRVDGRLTLEVIVIDNASKDGSADTVARSYPQVHLIQNAENRGFAQAVNQGLRASSGRNRLLLNPDAVAERKTLEAMADYLDHHSETGAVGVQLLHEDGRLQNSIASFPTLATELLNKSLLTRLFPHRFPGKNRPFEGPMEVESLIGACMMVKGKVIQSVGLLDERYFFFLEETDWCLRMRRAGWKIVFLPELRVPHLQGKSASRNLTAARIEYYRSRYRFFILHRGRTATALLRGGLIVKLLVECTGSLLLIAMKGFSDKKETTRLRVRLGLLAWHLTGCPDDEGLEKAGTSCGQNLR